MVPGEVSTASVTQMFRQLSSAPISPSHNQSDESQWGWCNPTGRIVEQMFAVPDNTPLQGCDAFSEKLLGRS